jgi:hypothetical protein
MSSLLVILLVVAFIVFIVIVIGIARRNRRTNTDPTWYRDQALSARDVRLDIQSHDIDGIYRSGHGGDGSGGST